MEKTFGREIATWGVMLMQCVNGNARSRRSSRLGQCVTESIVSPVPDPDPVNGTQHDRKFGPKNHHSTTPQTEFLDPFDSVVRHHGADGWSRVNVELR